MAKVVLFGGGDGGGFIFSERGVRPIPPFDPAVRLQLRGLSALLAGTRRMSGKPPRELGTLLNKVANLVVEQVEAVVGPVDGEDALVYQDDDGGFTCGSTGKPPIPFPWPPLALPSVNELIAVGVLERELVDFVSAASERKIDMAKLLEDPSAVADKIGLTLSLRAAADLQQLAPSRIEHIKDPTDKEIVGFFHAVLKDGRFLADWAKRPAETAEKLKIKLSDKAFEKIIAGGSIGVTDPGSVMNPVAIAVVVGVVIMLVPTEAGRGKLVIRDFSGRAKF